MRLIWSQECHIMSTSIKYYSTIALFTFRPWHHGLGFTSVAGISQKILFETIFLDVWHQFCYVKCLKYQTKSPTLSSTKKKPFWTSFVIHFCYLCNSCYFCYEMKCLLFFLFFCYQMKCLGTLNICLSLFFSYVYYSCRISQLKYQGTIWTTLYLY